MTLPTTVIAGRGEIRLCNASLNYAISNPTTWWASASARSLRAWNTDLSGLKKKGEKDPALRPYAFDRSSQIMLAKEQVLKTTIFLAGSKTTGGYGVTTTTGAYWDGLTELLVYGNLGNYSSGVTRYADSGCSTTVVKVNTASGLTAGNAIYVNHEARRIASVDGTNLTLDMALTSAPSASDLVYASITHFFDPAYCMGYGADDYTPQSFLYRGYDSADQWQVRGTFTEIELGDLAPGKVPTLNVSVYGQSWETVTGVAVGSTPSDPDPPPQSYGALYYQTVGSTTKNILHPRTLSIKLNQKQILLPSPSDEEGILAHMFSDQTYPSIEFEAPYDSAFLTAYEAQTNKFVGYQIGRSSTSQGAILLTFPNCRIEETPIPVDRSGERLMKVKMFAAAEQGSSTKMRSPYAIHRFPKLAA